MLTVAKINLKKYVSLSAALLISSYFTVKSIDEYRVVILVFLASCANHWMLFYVVRRMSENAVNKISNSTFLTSLFSIAKLLIVVGALSFGVQIMGKRIIIPVLIYVLQIVVLYFSFEKTSTEPGT
jgi:hypothetical protein